MNELFRHKEVKVLLAMEDSTASTKLLNFLAEEGVFCRAANSPEELKEFVWSWKPDFVIIDLLYPELNALMFLKNLKQNDKTTRSQVKVFVASQFHNNTQNVKECLRWGAADYLIMPVKHGDVISRIVLHTQEKREVKDYTQKDQQQQMNEAQYYLHLTELTLKEAMKFTSLDSSMHNLSKMVAMAMKAVRVSIVECNLENRVGIVHGSSDNRDVKQLQLKLEKYPEIIYTLTSAKILAIDSLEKDPTMNALSEKSKSIHFTSMIVAPIETPTGVWGVLSTRMPNSRGRFDDIEIQFVMLVAHVVSIVVQRHLDAEKMLKAA